MVKHCLRWHHHELPRLGMIMISFKVPPEQPKMLVRWMDFIMRSLKQQIEQTVSGVLPWTLMRNTYIYFIKLKRSFQSSSLWQGASTKIATPTRDLEINRANTTPGEYCWGWFNGLSNIWGGFCLSICRVLPRKQWQSTTQERNICEVYINEFLTVYSSEEVCENCHVGILEMRPSMTGKANPKTCR